MIIFKTLCLSAAMLTGSALVSAPAYASDFDDAVAITQSCIDLDLFELTDYNSAINKCRSSVQSLVDVATGLGDNIDLETLALIGEIAGTSAVSWSIIELRKAGNVFNSDVCTPVSMAESLFELMDDSEVAAKKESSGLNMLLEKCN